MNATSVVMREWRRAQTAQAAPATVLPEALQQASTAALASLWNQAPALANESLRSAQASWDAERGELAGQAARANQAGALRQERDAAQLDATQARERAAELAGELAQADTQNAELLVRLAAPKAKR